MQDEAFTTTSGGLSERERLAFRRDGVLFPLPAISTSQALEYRGRLDAVGRARRGQIPPAFNLKAHLLFPWLWDLVHDPRIVDPVGSVLGSDLYCWGASFFDKRPGDPQHVHWHQDATYWGLDRPDALTAWIALTPSSAANGCMRVLPGTHDRAHEHVHSHDRNSMLLGEEMLATDVDEASAVDVTLRPGEMSLHHLLLIHGSKVNTSNERRTGFAIRYVAGHLRQTGTLRGSATHVRGHDHGHFQLERPPEGELHPAALRRYAEIFRRTMAIVTGEIRASREEQRS